MQIKTKFNHEELQKIKTKLKEYKKIMTAKEFVNLMSGTVINSDNLQIIVGVNCVKFRINCDD